jgi:NAD(P)H-dependent flavin oxidoreductase YrpB (nitropropane dioxygenase family)
MIRTRICEALGIAHPIVLGGMGGGTSVPLVAAVSNAGALGTLGVAGERAGGVRRNIAAIREATDRPFAVNFLLFMLNQEAFQAALEAPPPVIAFAWPRLDRPLAPIFDRVHEAGAKVMFMAGDVPMARRGAEAGADFIVAHGTEGGGHVSWMASLPLVPMVVDAVAPVPVIAAGGIADGRGLAAALALGAEGALLGTRFLATEESPLPDSFKEAIVDSDGHDTVLTEIPDIASGLVWPGAMARALRNDFIERWAGREWALRAHRAEANDALAIAREAADVENGLVYLGQDAGLITEVLPAAEVVRRVAEQAEEILAGRMAQALVEG